MEKKEKTLKLTRIQNLSPFSFVEKKCSLNSHLNTVLNLLSISEPFQILSPRKQQKFCQSLVFSTKQQTANSD